MAVVDHCNGPSSTTSLIAISAVSIPTTAVIRSHTLEAITVVVDTAATVAVVVDHCNGPSPTAITAITTINTTTTIAVFIPTTAVICSDTLKAVDVVVDAAAVAVVDHCNDPSPTTTKIITTIPVFIPTTAVICSHTLEVVDVVVDTATAAAVAVAVVDHCDPTRPTTKKTITVSIPTTAVICSHTMEAVAVVGDTTAAASAVTVVDHCNATRPTTSITIAVSKIKFISTTAVICSHTLEAVAVVVDTTTAVVEAAVVDHCNGPSPTTNPNLTITVSIPTTAVSSSDTLEDVGIAMDAGFTCVENSDRPSHRVPSGMAILYIYI